MGHSLLQRNGVGMNSAARSPSVIVAAMDEEGVRIVPLGAASEFSGAEATVSPDRYD